MVDEAMKKQNEEFMGSDLSLPHCFSRILPSWLEICMIDMCLKDGEARCENPDRLRLHGQGSNWSSFLEAHNALMRMGSRPCHQVAYNPKLEAEVAG